MLGQVVTISATNTSQEGIPANTRNVLWIQNSAKSAGYAYIQYSNDAVDNAGLELAPGQLLSITNTSGINIVPQTSVNVIADSTATVFIFEN